MFGSKEPENNHEDHETAETTTEEEYEFYDMSEFEKKLFNRVAVLEDKIDAVLSEVEDNNHRLKNIQFQFTRALLIRVFKWLLIFGVLYYVYISFIEPVIFKAGEVYTDYEILQQRLQLGADSDQSTIDRLKKFFPGQE